MDHNEVAARLTPNQLMLVLHQLAGSQPADLSDSISLTTVVYALSGKQLGHGKEGWQAYLRLKQAIKDACEQLPGIRFVEGDS